MPKLDAGTTDASERESDAMATPDASGDASDAGPSWEPSEPDLPPPDEKEENEPSRPPAETSDAGATDDDAGAAPSSGEPPDVGFELLEGEEPDEAESTGPEGVTPRAVASRRAGQGDVTYEGCSMSGPPGHGRAPLGAVAVVLAAVLVASRRKRR